MGKKGGGGKQIVGYRYKMAVHMGIGRGPIDELCEIRIGDLQAWTGSITSSGSSAIDKPDLFGGDDKEGGVVGTFKMFMGEPTQIPNDDPFITSNIQSALPIPGWRGAATIFYYGQIGSNNPYPKTWKMRVRRAVKGWDNDSPWYPEKAVIVLAADPVVLINFTGNPGDGEYIVINGLNAVFKNLPTGAEVAIGDSIDTTVANLVAAVNFFLVDVTAVGFGNSVEIRGTVATPVVEIPFGWANVVPAGNDIHAMNPAHIVYECATNRVWGRGLPAALIDDAAFRAAADTLFNEQFGLCLRWNRDDDIDAFVKLVINHIGAAVYIDRATGLLTLKLIRDDYDVDLLPVFTFENGLLDIVEDELSSTNTTFNEVIVEFLDPVADKKGQVRVQNLASYQSTGTIVSNKVEYMGCATAALAVRLAQRDLDLNSLDLRRLKLKFTRAAWRIAPAGVFRIQAPSRGIGDMVVRVGRIEDSPLIDGIISMDVIQDVFNFPDTSYVTPESTHWVPPDQSPRVVSDRLITEMTWFDLSENVPSAELAMVQPDTGFLKIFAKQPAPSNIDYLVLTEAEGEAEFVQRSIAGWDPAAKLSVSVGHYDTELTLDALPTGLTVGEPIIVGDEYMRLDAIDDNVLTVARGCIDAIPAPHLHSVTVWFQTAAPTTDFRDYASGETVFIKLLPRTAGGVLDEAFAPIDEIEIGARQGRPYPPGNLTVNDEPFGNDPHIVVGDIIFDWAHRDRIVQGNVLVEHIAGTTGPEPGTTYTVRVYAEDGITLLRTETGIPDETWTYDTGTAVADGDLMSYWFEIEAVRDGFPSWQHYRFQVFREIGFDEGFDFNFDGGF